MESFVKSMEIAGPLAIAAAIATPVIMGVEAGTATAEAGADLGTGTTEFLGVNAATYAPEAGTDLITTGLVGGGGMAEEIVQETPSLINDVVQAPNDLTLTTDVTTPVSSAASGVTPGAGLGATVTQAAEKVALSTVTGLGTTVVNSELKKLLSPAGAATGGAVLTTQAPTTTPQDSGIGGTLLAAAGVLAVMFLGKK